MNDEIRQLQAAIAALEAQRALLGDAVVALAVAPLQARLAALASQPPVAPPVSPPPPPQKRRLVSVLFTDIVGSTSLSQHLDPEEIHHVMDGALAAFTRSVEQLEGRVLQYAGDSMLAVFGADGAREDDAERAVRAALAVIDEGRRRGLEVARRYGHEGFNVRVGVHTGPVLLGGGVDDEGSIRGMTVNVAARLEQTAPPGTLRISHETWRLVRSRFQAEPQPPLQVKGRDEPLVSYLVTGERAPSAQDDGRGIEGLGTVLVGREAEFAALWARWHEARARPGVHVQCVQADAGLGKSRLLRSWLAARAQAAPAARHAVQVRAVPASQRRPFGLMRELLLAALGLGDDTPAETFAETAAQTLGEPGAQPARARLLGHLLGWSYPEPADAQALRDAGPMLREQAFGIGCELLHACARQHGEVLLVLLDDLHWADDATLAFLRRLWRHPMPDASLLLLVLARPSLRERAAGWPGDADGVPTLTLSPLDTDQRSRLADALLAPFGPVPPEDLRTLLLERAGGNPYFMEELLQMLLDQGAVVTSTTPWTLDRERLRADRVPTTLAGVLQARLDSLPAAERTALQEASVVGPVFWDQALAAIDDAAPSALPPLRQRGLVLEDADEAPAAGPRHAFHHQLLHEVTYDTVLRSLRRAWHLRVAQWIERRPPAEREPLLGTLALHFEQGGELAAAARAFAQAAARDAARHAHASAEEQARRALELAAQLPEPHPADITEARWQALLARQRALRVQGRLEEQATILAEMEAIATARADAAGLATVALRRATAQLAAGDAAAAAAACPAARERARAAGQAETEVAVCSTWLGALRALGRFDEAQRIAEDGLALARQNALSALQSEMLSAQAALASERGEPLRALALLEQSLAIDVASGSRFTECTTRINLGDAYGRLGRLAPAQQAFEAALALARAIGARGYEAMALLNLAGVARLAGDAAASLAHAARAQETAAAAGNREYEAYALIALGHAAQAAGGADARAAARAAYGAAVALLRRLGLEHVVVEAEAGLLRVALDDGDLAAVHAGVDAIDAHVATHGAGFEGAEHPAWIDLAWWRGLERLGEPRALTVRAEARRRLLEQAARLPGEDDRALFLGALPHHRALLDGA